MVQWRVDSAQAVGALPSRQEGLPVPRLNLLRRLGTKIKGLSKQTTFGLLKLGFHPQRGASDTGSMRMGGPPVQIRVSGGPPVLCQGKPKSLQAGEFLA